MKRRAFLGFLGGAAVAGPQAAKSAAQMTMADTSFAGLGLARNMGALAAGSESPDKSWAVTSLKRLVGMSDVEVARRKRGHYVDGLDPEVASLRSVSLVHKVRMTRDRAFERRNQDERTYLEGVIAGLWD